MTRLIAVIVALVALHPSASADPGVLRVGTHDDPPFVIKQPNGQWSGIGIELLRSIAAELGDTVTILDLEKAQLVDGPLPDVDVVAFLNVTEKMNARYDLSHAFYSTGLSIAVPEGKKEPAWAVLVRIFSGGFLWIMVGVAILLAAVGLLMFWVERRPVKPQPPEKAALSKALFWAFEPVIGYKASQHVTRAGRVIGTVWGVFGVVLVSGLTANLASQLTAHQLASAVRGPADLPRVRVAVVAHTRGKTFCDRRGIRRKEFDTVDEALTALEHGEVDAAIEDAPNLAYATRDAHKHLTILPGTFANHGYSFGLRPDSPIRHEFNKALVKIVGADSWGSLVASYLGASD